MLLGELEQKFNNLYREATAPDLDPVQVVRKIEQQKGVAYSMTLIDTLIAQLEDEAEEERRIKEIKEES